MNLSFELLKILPKNVLSHYIGKLLHVRWPQPLAQWSIQVFAKIYKINIAEAEKPLEEYTSIGDFFVRRLREGVRPLAPAELIHPADAVLTQLGPLQDGNLIQAKGKNYKLQDLLQEEPGSQSLQELKNGAFAVYYLCPTDYHRVHSPVSGVVRKVRWIPGTLWPVNSISTQEVERLFCVNERVVVYIETPQGLCVVVLVGATNVGQMSLSFEDSVHTNNLKQKTIWEKSYEPGLSMKAGDELGAFHMGSTVVLVCEEKLAQSWPLTRVSHYLGKATRVRSGF
jgi:phosphatidylserine decarboxylase